MLRLWAIVSLEKLILFEEGYGSLMRILVQRIAQTQFFKRIDGFMEFDSRQIYDNLSH